MRTGNKVYTHEDLLELLHETEASDIINYLFQFTDETDTGSRQFQLLWAPVSEGKFT